MDEFLQMAEDYAARLKPQAPDTKKKPIPRLYTAGMLGSAAGHIYSMAGHNWAAHDDGAG